MSNRIKDGMMHTPDEQTMGRDYYCSMKFRYIKIDLESQTSYTCHASKPHRIDFDWLEKNPGNLFNHDVNIQERQMMLRNERAPSCEQNCWRAEDTSQVSPRLYQKGYIRTHDVVVTKPEMMDITVGADCNLTCSYCCKEYSSSWRRDLADHGDYDLDGMTEFRYQLTDHDRLLMKISQPNLMKSSKYNLLLDEIKQVSQGLSRIDVTGGEPFLNNKIVDLLENLETNDQTVINVYTGLGVDHSRFNQILDKLCKNKKIKIVVSGEGIRKHLEFNRYGITWSRFEKNLASILNRDIQFRFHCTLTNLTAFGFKEFYDYYCMHDIRLTFAYNPVVQVMNVMDQDSKVRLIESFSTMPDKYREPLEKTISPIPTELQRKNMAKFLATFVKRRPDIDLSIYPSSFIDWLGIDRVV
jgi:organic radical activating enzyme